MTAHSITFRIFAPANWWAFGASSSHRSTIPCTDFHWL